MSKACNRRWLRVQENSCRTAYLTIDGPELTGGTYRRMLASIREARNLIYVETCIFAGDEVGRRFATTL